MKLHSLAISGVVTLNLHALNNEGSEGNTMMTRMVEIVDESGTLQTVNAISGDMFKHIQAEHLFQEAKLTGLPLCAGCSQFDANRIARDFDLAAQVEKSKEYAEAKKNGKMDSYNLSQVLKACVIDDCEGILLTGWAGSKSLARKSCIEFGWVVGRPEKTRTEAYIHAKYVPEGRGAGSGSEQNLGQNLFHRPASSGQYAVVLNVDLYRVGRNDITLEYDLGSDERKKRVQALLRSVLYTFIKPTGAHRNTQHPHIVDFSGVVATSANSLPAPTVSALNNGYDREIEVITSNLNSLFDAEHIQISRFEGLGDYSRVMSEIIKAVEPWGD
ncbi:DevR family CRISPR-associated autoregulator [Desulforudis sp. 1088]|uniref:DevR family CRISPR-associated autoregulator n=1 Tax=unclassified Candidatus Desulforudis TaxID=2635950 RepID=UPI003CE487A1